MKFALKFDNNIDEAYVHYLHEAVLEQQKDPNIQPIQACAQAIEKVSVIKSYNQAKIRLFHDLHLSKRTIGHTIAHNGDEHSKHYKKSVLISMCAFELKEIEALSATEGTYD